MNTYIIVSFTSFIYLLSINYLLSIIILYNIKLQYEYEYHN